MKQEFKEIENALTNLKLKASNLENENDNLKSENKKLESKVNWLLITISLGLISWLGLEE